MSIMYFIPEWDDQVDVPFDFFADQAAKHSKKRYAHEIYDNPPYDGILLSKLKLEQSKKKMRLLNDQGLKLYYRYQGPFFGDCGAWGYVKENEPPFSTSNVFNFYNKLGFDYGVSIDHLAVTKDQDANIFRCDLTVKNAEEFYNMYQSKSPDFTPVGAIQGFDVHSYRQNMKEIIDIGYTHIAIGGLARTPSETIIEILRNMQDLIEGNNLWIHLFGVGRLSLIRNLIALGVSSFDSTSQLRKAWLGQGNNYFDKYFQGYSAIRVPYLTEKNINGTNIDLTYSSDVRNEIMDWENTILTMLRDHLYKGMYSVDEIVEAFQDFNSYFFPNRPDYSKYYYQTLQDRPWERCACTICKNIGAEVIIFKGNNRNRRRGFHNTYVFYKILKKIKEDPEFEFTEYRRKGLKYKTPINVYEDQSKDNSEIATVEDDYDILEGSDEYLNLEDFF